MGRKKNSKSSEEFIDYNPLDTMVPDNYVEEEPLEKTMQIMTPEDFKRLTDLGIGDIDSKDAPDEEVEIEHADRVIEKDIPEDEYITLDAYGTKDRVEEKDDLDDTFAIELPSLKHIDEVTEEDDEDDSSGSVLDLEDRFNDEKNNSNDDDIDGYDDLFQDIFSDEEDIYNKYESLKEFEKKSEELDTLEDDDKVESLETEEINDSDILENIEEDTQEKLDDNEDKDETFDEEDSLLHALEDSNFNEKVDDELISEEITETDNVQEELSDNDEVLKDIPLEDNPESEEDSIDLDIDFDDTIVMDPLSTVDIEPTADSELKIEEPITLATSTLDEEESKEIEDFLFDNIDNKSALDDENKNSDDGFLEEEDIRTVDDNKVISSLEDETFADNGFARDLIELENSKDIDEVEEVSVEESTSTEESKEKTAANKDETSKEKVVVVTKQPVKQVVVKQNNPFQAVAPNKESNTSPVEQSLDSHLEENSRYVRDISKTEKIIAGIVIVIIIILSIYLIVSTVDNEKVGTDENNTTKATTTKEVIITKPSSTTTKQTVITVPRNTTTSRTTYELIPNIPGN